MRRCPPSAGGSKRNGQAPSSDVLSSGTGHCWNAQMSVMPALAATPPTFTLGAALSYSTTERPLASWPVTTRRIGRIGTAMALFLIRLDVRGLDHFRGARDVSAHEG